ncbi:hypothetical protein T4A_1349 [Trichinella pseudospiralis]|uniref:Uncharacterized protein n=1 Tax=Trichinella pseudospiralis TaxID=6337 RepID=A0A0V1KCD5_TRIPS|nr:hypothetical protein T4A_1349 [Trichinella pseudospiralis]KRZ44873.1 hypothetical protein T4C_8265 [Trichinella pseudospiralis]
MDQTVIQNAQETCFRNAYCCYMTTQAWNSISGSWNKFLGCNEKCVNQSVSLFEMKSSKQWRKDENKNVKLPNHSEDYSCLKVGLKLEYEKEFSATQLMLIRHIRDVAAQKKPSSFKQKFITDYIEHIYKLIRKRKLS